MTIMIGALMALVLFGYLAIPLIFPSQSDPLPSQRDPVEQDLEEERDALFRAIRELEAREDLPQERRDQLRARYEAKAAKVLRSLDERQALLRGQSLPTPAELPRRRVPYTALALIAFMVITGVAMNNYLLPRIGSSSTVTEFDETSLVQGRALKKLQQAAKRKPNETNLLALADAYWQLQDVEQAAATYEQIASDISPVPDIVYSRLGFISLQTDLDVAKDYFEKARDINPGNLDTLFTLGEIYFAIGELAKATEVWNDFLAVPEGKDDETVRARLALADTVREPLEAFQTEANEETMTKLADTYWQIDERERAADLYMQVLREFNPNQADALSRVGQVVFFSGRNEDAIIFLSRARQFDGENLNTLLFLGNAYFSLNAFEEAIEVWEAYVEVAGEDNAGRVPSLIAQARSNLAGEPVASQNVSGQTSGEQLYSRNCAACHGAIGQGGIALALIGNALVEDTGRLESIIVNGKGMMPAFGFMLSEEDIGALVSYTSTVIFTGSSSSQ